jgi:Tol biopolymer transport system component
MSRLTSNPANEIHALWSPDGSKVLFSSNRNGAYELYEKSAEGTNTEEKLVLALQSPGTDWSADGRSVLTQRRGTQGSSDIWVLSTGPEQAALPLAQTEFDERDGQFSPDGKWIAYASNESARWEIYVAAFPGPGPKVRISIAGGAQARWRKDGKELFYIALDNRLMAVPITVKGSSLEPGNPVPLFATRLGGAIQGSSRQQYFVSPDGQRFLMNTVLDGNTPSAITVILNWKPEAARAVK